MKTSPPLSRLLLFACACICSQLLSATAATVTTDQADYSPGATAHITGAGFLAGETVELQVLHTTTPNDDATSPAHQPWQVTADAQGNFLSTWYVPTGQDEVGATLELTATGLSSGRVAQTTFTDDAAANVIFATSVLPSGVSISVSYSGKNNGGNSI